MKYRRESQRVFVRLETGEDLHASVLELAEREGITGGAVTALGAVRDVVLGYYDLERRDYARTSVPGEVELASAVGTLSRLDGKPHLHLHAVLSDRECRTYGGHLFSAKATATVELFVRVADAPIERTPDEATGLSLWRV
ncbi:MAG: PPC domain-containing DNA-binding protein [Thermoanaerobaculia bacterium]